MSLTTVEAQQRVARGAHPIISADDVQAALDAEELAQVKRRAATEALVMLTEFWGVEMAERLLDAYDLVGSTEMRRLLNNIRSTRLELGLEPHRRG
jgi:hypothetical protein